MWLAIEGIIGAGKTTTAQLLGVQTSLAPLIERSDQHPLLGAYYSNPSRFAFETELIFMALQAHQVAADGRSEFVSDFAPAKNFVFARTTCSPDDLTLLKEIDERLWRELPRPEMVVVLDVPPRVCLQRIIERGHAYERSISVAYLEGLRDGYMTAISELGSEVELLGLSGDEAPDEVARRVADLARLG